MSTMVAISKDHPLWIAYETYKKSDEYKNTAQWAVIQKEGEYPHLTGSLWAAFEAGYRAALTAPAQEWRPISEAPKDGTAFPALSDG